MIFSCYTAREEETWIYQSHFISEEEKKTYLKSVKGKSLYTTGSQPSLFRRKAPMISGGLDE